MLARTLPGVGPPGTTSHITARGTACPKRHQNRRITRPTFKDGALAAVLRLTTLPLQISLGEYANTVPWWEKISWIPLLVIDPRTFVLNIIMTVPLGVLLPLLIPIRGVRQVTMVGLGFSAAIEVVQLCTNVFLSSGDLADVNDLLANTLGAVAGFLFLRRLTRIGAMADLAARFRTFDEPPVSGDGLSSRPGHWQPSE